MVRILRAALVLLSLISLNAGAQTVSPPDKAQYSNLAGEIDQILQRTHTPGAAVALFEPDGSVWRYTTGLKNIERKEKINSDTIFRLGSVSKMFVGLAVMKLVADGELSLQDRLTDLAPEIEFDNPWEREQPVRVIHLLNHSTGWDAPHASELVGQSGEPLDIAAALARHPHSRRSRWVPGTRTAYNNTGPLVAAYLVEKIVGERFEDYIQQQIFDPLSMHDSGYYFDDQYRSNAADLYRGKKALPYWHLPNRAAGGMHSSLEDMIRFVRFMQQPDQVATGEILTSEMVRAMEVPSGSSAAEAGLQVGWGTGLTSFHHESVVFYGHEGALPGARALVAYQPQSAQRQDVQGQEVHGDSAMGHIVLTNGDSPAAGQIHQLLSEYSATRQSAAHFSGSEAAGQPNASLAGFYRVISPVADRFRIATSLMPWRIIVAEHSVMLSPLFGGQPRKLLVSKEGNYLQPDTGRVALVKTEDPLAGSVVHYGPVTLQKTNAASAMAPILLLIIWLIATLLGCICLLFWLPRKLFGRGLAQADVRMRGWSLLPAVGLIIAAVGALLISRSGEPYAVSATVTLPSLMVFAGPLLFLLAALWSLRIYQHCRAGATAGFWRGHATALIFLNAVVAVYLFSYGLIGIRLWA